MLTGIDHVILGVADVDVAAAEVEAKVGLRAGAGGRHDAHGTHNRLIWLGDSYVELMGVFDAALAAESWWGRHLLRVLSASPAGLAGVVFTSSDLEADVRMLRSHGSPISDPVPGERVRPDGDVVRWRIGRLPEPDPDLGLTFLIEHDASSVEWRAADRAARASEAHPVGGTARLARVVLGVDSPGRTSLRVLRALGVQFRPSLAGAGARDASVGSQTLRLVAARSGASATIVIRAAGLAEPRSAELLGVRWEIVPA